MSGLFRVITEGPMSGHGFRKGAVVRFVAPDPFFPEHLSDYQMVEPGRLHAWMDANGEDERHIQSLESCDVEALP